VIPALRRWIDGSLATGKPLLIVLAGSNGAGKSTYYRLALATTGLPFVNADEIAKSMRPSDPGSVAYEAMRRAEALREDMLSRRESFIMETVLSDTQGAKLALFRRARKSGYTLVVVHITLASLSISISRVLQRVRDGGHDVPDDKLEARFPRTRANAAKALAIADLGIVLDNSDLEIPYRHVETWSLGRRLSSPTDLTTIARVRRRPTRR
jgi:predicted ABC-type ATPase